jgi:LPS-assembly protein
VLNLGYRYNRNVLKQAEVSGQWPLGGGWYGVGRLAYSLDPGSLTDGLAGLEYDGGCWVVRLVARRFATAVGVQNNAILLQLELNGLASIGSNPLSLLRGNISGYTPLNRSTDPIRPLGIYN